MKKPKLDETGTARCPKCGSQSFVQKRTLKGKVAGGLLLAPKRLRCVSCGTYVKAG